MPSELEAAIEHFDQWLDQEVMNPGFVRRFRLVLAAARQSVPATAEEVAEALDGFELHFQAGVPPLRRLGRYEAGQIAQAITRKPIETEEEG